MIKIEWVIAVLFGAVAIVFNKRIANGTIEWQNRTWGFRFDDRAVTGARALYIIAGAASVILGALATLGLIDTK